MTECGFCKGKPVGNAARWYDLNAPEFAPCPRCGVYREPYADLPGVHERWGATLTNRDPGDEDDAA